jgi:heptosyltransferase-2
MNIAVFLPNWIGDVVMATPAVRALRQQFPSAHLVGVCKPYVLGVLEGAPWFHEMVFLDSKGPWSQRWPGAAANLWRENMDIAILFPNSFRSALVAWLAGCRRRIGFNRYLRGGLLTDRLEPLRDATGTFQPTPIIDDYNRLVEKIGCPKPGHRMELFTTPADEQAADQVGNHFHLEDYPEVICLNPGAAFGAAKHWPAASFAQVARDLVSRRGCAILVLCGPGERELAREIVQLAGVPRVFSLADQRLSLGLTKALIRRSALLITTDSGPRHFAAAFNRPVVTLFGPTHIEWTETYFARAINLQKKVPCGPCQQRVCPLDHRCMTKLTPAEVLATADQLLTGPATVSPVVLERKAS